MRKKAAVNIVFKLVLTVLFIFLFSSVSLNATVRIEPSRHILTLYPDVRVTETISVTNQTGETLDLIANFYDWNLNERYELETYPSGTLESSLEGLFRFNPRNFTLSPGETQIVRFTIHIPEEKNNIERRGIIFVEHEENMDEEGIGATILTRIGTTVYAIPGDFNFAFNLRDKQVVKNNQNQIFGAYLTRNIGDIHLRFTLEYSLINANGRKIEEGKVEEKVLLPGMERGIIVPLNSQLEPGDYQMVSRFKFPGSLEILDDIISFTVEQ